ncbi:MAG: hypothetical protein IJS56_00890 [Bacilli bacterium]|nr:hypothetical protein [Bacilli bacterium]
MNYVVKKIRRKYLINYMEYDLEGLVIHPKLKGDNYIKVKSAKFYDEEIINRIVRTKFKRQFNNLTNVVFTYLSSDDETDSGDYMILLDEVAKLQATLQIRYQRFMDNEAYSEYMDKLYFLGVNLKNKLARINLMDQIQNQMGGMTR